MTTRQAHELDRIAHRYGRTRVASSSTSALVLDVHTDADYGRPLFRLVLDEHGLVLKRVAGEELAPALDPLEQASRGERRGGVEVERDTVVLEHLRRRARHWEAAAAPTFSAWQSSRAIAQGIDENVAHVAASLRRLYANGLVESDGLSRDKVWRAA